MKVRSLALFILVLIAVNTAGQGKNDVVVMKNGDRITCEIVSLEGGSLNVKLDYADGTISLQWSKVERVESNRLYIVRTEKGNVHTGTLSTVTANSGEPLKIEIGKAPDDKVEIGYKEVVTIGTTTESFWSRFKGNISVGMSYAKGNQATQYNLNSSIEYPSGQWNAKASLSSNLSSSSSSNATTRNNLRVRANRLLPRNNYFVTGTVSLLESSEQDIGFQSNLGGGLGYFFKNTNRTKFALIGGVGWQRTNYTGSGTARNTQNAVAALVSTEIQFFKFKKTNFDLDATLLPSISEPGRVYFRLNQSYNVKLYRDLSWNISFYGNWDSRPPIGLSGNDYGTSMGLGWTFGSN